MALFAAGDVMERVEGLLAGANTQAASLSAGVCFVGSAVLTHEYYIVLTMVRLRATLQTKVTDYLLWLHVRANPLGA